MYGNLRSKLDLQEENFPFSLPLKEKFSHNEVIFLPAFWFTKLLLGRGSSLFLGNILPVTVFLQFSKKPSNEVHLFFSKLTLKSEK